MQGLGKQKVGYFRKISQMASKFGFFCEPLASKNKEKGFSIPFFIKIGNQQTLLQMPR
jgi:hypothetical protein